jgi:cellulose synthase/poly-beta-1,6-N-acetylglucosamine synthase-like glycosyltransferase
MRAFVALPVYIWQVTRFLQIHRLCCLRSCENMLFHHQNSVWFPKCFTRTDIFELYLLAYVSNYVLLLPVYLARYGKKA